MGESTVAVGVIGFGAIGRTVSLALRDGAVAEASLTGVLSFDKVDESGIEQLDLDALIESSDIIVEAAGQGAIEEYGEQILSCGVDLLVVSIGAMADRRLSARLAASGPGRMFYAAGAIGGLDLLVGARRVAPLNHVRLTTTKLPSTLIQPWMDAQTVQRLRTATQPLVIYSGTPKDVVAKFPKSTNVAAGLALAAQTWDIEVVVRADPAAEMTTHTIEATSPIGTYRFEICNQPDERNPATSKLVPYSVLRSISVYSRSERSIL